jgi:CRISPR-associated exonuclease Cas4
MAELTPELIELVQEAERRELHGLLFQNITLCPLRAWLHYQRVDCAHLNRHMRRGLADQEGRYRGKLAQWSGLGIAPDLVDFKAAEISEVKSSRSFPDASKAQLLFYMAVLSVNTGRPWSGTLRFPGTRRLERLALDTAAQQRLIRLASQLIAVLDAPAPPRARRTAVCDDCSYRLLCWGRSSDDEDRV